MSSWRIERHYGFGAAQIPIQPEPHRAAQIGLVEGMQALVGELTEGGIVATMRRAAGEASAVLLGLLILAAVIVTLMRDHSDVSSIEIVLLESVVQELQPIVEEPVPVEIAKPELPKKQATAKPSPPQQIAETPKPPPSPVVKPKSRPKPVIPDIARVEAPKPPLERSFDRAVRERPQTIARPRVTIDAARPKPKSPSPRVDRIARTRVEPTNPARLSPRLDTPAAPALDLPGEAAPPKRAFRVASAKPVPARRPGGQRVIAAAPPHIEMAATASVPRPARTSGPRPTPSHPMRAPLPRLSSTPVRMAPPARVAMPERSARLVPTAAVRRMPRPKTQIARVANLFETPPPLPTSVSRSDRAAPTAPRGPRGDRTSVAGVPLGELAACLSDREEDRLKQAIVAAVTTQEECVSSKGSYRFVETKNLNAFLMWIDRAPARVVSDRCVELGFALECLQSASRRAAR